jgi:hypothetical protein
MRRPGRTAVGAAVGDSVGLEVGVAVGVCGEDVFRRLLFQSVRRSASPPWARQLARQ